MTESASVVDCLQLNIFFRNMFDPNDLQNKRVMFAM
jgi:hypothetical protein